MFSWSGETAEDVCIESRSFRDRSGSSSEYRETPKICSPACMARSLSGRISASLCVGAIMVSAGNDFAVRAAMARAHEPSDTAGEHGTPTPVLVRPHGRAPTSKSGVREHTPYSRCSSRTTRTRTKIKHAQMTTKPAFFGRIRLHLEEPEVPVLKVANPSKLSARFGRFLPNYPAFPGLFGLFGQKMHVVSCTAVRASSK